MKHHQVIFPVVALMYGGILSCSPAISDSSDTTINSVSSPVIIDPELVPPTDAMVSTEDQEDIARIVEGEEKVKIFNEVIAVQADIGLCEGEDNLSEISKAPKCMPVTRNIQPRNI
ncbi:MAG: hypothetical protein HC799_07115 [Limnothrix sp. RL_2_0]|nr:hypothetical protein [Limnothrix sp. RL_2_0]